MNLCINFKIRLPSVLVFFLLNCIFSKILGQENIQINLSTQGSVGTDLELPFWMRSNRLGQIKNQNGGTFILGVSNDESIELSKNIALDYGLASASNLGDNSNFFLDEAFAGFTLKDEFFLNLGIRHDSIKFEGLSSSNGNFAESQNARDLPGIEALSNYFKLPFAKNWLAIKGELSEKVFLDDRFVNKARQHHKNLYTRVKPNSKWNLELGLEHYVQWGGRSDSVGNGFDNYLRAFFSLAGTESKTNINNAEGNHLGTNHIQLNKTSGKTHWSLYYSHPFEDSSGLNFGNFPDGLYGLFLDLQKSSSIISHLLFEFYYTRDQGGGLAGLPDVYFTNTTYRTGWQNFGQTIGSPFITPNVLGDQETIMVGNNSIIAYHLGAKGEILKNRLDYKTLLSFSENFINFKNAEGQEQFSSLLELNYRIQKVPFIFSLGSAVDIGEFLGDHFGVYLGAKYNFGITP